MVGIQTLGHSVYLKTIFFDLQIHFSKLKKPVVRLGFEDTHCPTARNLENEFYCDANNIISAVSTMFGESYEKVDPKLLFSHENKFRGPF